MFHIPVNVKLLNKIKVTDNIIIDTITKTTVSYYPRFWHNLDLGDCLLYLQIAYLE